MARLLTSGFEAPFSPVEEGWVQYDGTINTEGSSWANGGRDLGNQPGYGSPFGEARRSITGQHVCYCYDSNDGLTSAFIRTLPSAPSEAWGKFAWRSASGTRVGGGRLFEWALLGVGTICSLVQWDLGAVDVGIQLLSNSGSVLAQNQNQVIEIDQTQWQLIEWHLTLAGSAGRLEVWIRYSWGGVVKILDYRGPLAGPGGETTFNQVIIGQGNPSAGQVFNTNSRCQYDDIAINDTTGTTNNSRIGEGVILRRVPRFPGTSTQLLSDLGAADPQTNFKRLNRDDDPNGFVGTDTPGNKDRYVMSAAQSGEAGAEGTGLPLVRGYAPAIVLQAKAVQNGPSIGNIRYSLLPPAQAEIQAPAAPGLPLSNTGLTTVSHQLETNPNTGEPFAHDDLELVEAGFSLEA